MKTLVWHGCYDEAWKGVIPDSAFEHPAKFSKRLVERIIEHMEARGWLVKEERPIIADPFAGVGPTSLRHMNAIIQYAEEYIHRETAAGREPRTIRLTTEQIRYVDDWLRENRIPMKFDPKLDGKRRICGMEVDEV